MNVRKAGRPMNYRTEVPARQTAAECMHLLMDAGADEVRIRSADGQPRSVGFELDTPSGRRAFDVPVNAEGMQAKIVKASRAGELGAGGMSRARMESRAHAIDVAWRVLRDWLDAQLARVAAEQAALDEVLLGYMLVAPGETAYARLLAVHRLEITEGDG